MSVRVIAGAGLFVLAVILAVTASTLRGPRQDGPLSTSSRVSIVTPPLAVGEAFTWGSYLPGNPTTSDIRIEAIEPIGVRGLEVLGILLGYPEMRSDGVCLAIGAEHGFPPARIHMNDLSQAKGSTLPAKDRWTCGNYPSVVVGVRLLSDVASGSIEALRLLYWHNGTLFEVVMPYSLEVPQRLADTN